MEGFWCATLGSTNNGPGNYVIMLWLIGYRTMTTIPIKSLCKEYFNSFPLATLGISKSDKYINIQYEKDYVILSHDDKTFKITHENIGTLIDSLRTITHINPN